MTHCGIKIFDTYKELFDYNATVQVHLHLVKTRRLHEHANMIVHVLLWLRYQICFTRT